MGEKAKTILVVDDELSLTKALEVELRSQGFGVIIAQNGLEGFEKAMKNHPDLILLDLLMPKLSGLDMLERLRACKDDFCKTVLVVILTNLTSEDSSTKAKELGSSAYIIKSDISLKGLVQLIKTKLKQAK